MAVKKIKGGRWRSDFRDRHGRRHRRTFDLQRDAEEYEREERRRIQRRSFVAERDIPTVQAAGEEWLRSREDREPATYEYYRMHFDSHIIPRIGHLKLSEVNVQTIEHEIRDPLVRAKRLPTANKVLTTLSTFWKWAMRRGYASPDMKSPPELVERVRIPRGARMRRDSENVYTPGEIRAIIETTGSLKFQVAFALLSLGMRREEILGLQWSDIGSGWDAIKIERAVTLAKGPGEEKRRPKLKSTKSTAGERWIPLPVPVGTLLKKWRLRCPATELELILPSEARKILHPSTLYGALKRAQSDAKVRKLDIKAFRHTFATALLEAGEQDTQVARLMGHTDTTVTRRIYTHFFNRPETSAAVSQFASDIFGTEQKKRKGKAKKSA